MCLLSLLVNRVFCAHFEVQEKNLTILVHGNRPSNTGAVESLGRRMIENEKEMC